MALILAIEADRRQATLLASIGRRVGAELVIAPTAERGLEAIDGRVPDLILTSALLSPRDDAAIAARLRELDTAASHVQMLTTPVLARARQRPAQPGGLLGKLRGGASGATPAGCDPSLFAEQVAEYLQRAAAECHARETAHAEIVAETTEPSRDEIVIEAPPPLVKPAARVEPIVEAPGEAEIAPEPFIVEPVAAVVPMAALAPEPVVEVNIALDITVEESAPAVDPVVHDEPLIVPVAEVEMAPGPTIELVAGETDPEPQTADSILAEIAAATEQPAEPEVELADQLDAEPDAEVVDLRAASVNVDAALREFEAALAEIEPTQEACVATELTAEAEDVFDLSAAAAQTDAEMLATWADLSRAAAWPPLEGFTGEHQAETAPDEIVDAEAAIAAAPADAQEPAPTPPAVETAIAPPETRKVDQPKRQPRGDKRRKRAAKPVQDEWGLFDPEQCGFAALLQKLDELDTSADDAA